MCKCEAPIHTYAHTYVYAHYTHMMYGVHCVHTYMYTHYTHMVYGVYCTHTCIYTHYTHMMYGVYCVHTYICTLKTHTSTHTVYRSLSAAQYALHISALYTSVEMCVTKFAL